MLYFISLIITALTILVTLAVWLLCRSLSLKKSKNNYLKKLEETSRLTGQLAHEIKNPLSTIKVNLKLIGEDLERAKGGGGRGEIERILSGSRRKVSVVQKEAERLEQILDGFLRYISRTELNLAEADINELISDMVDFYTPQADGHSITIRQGLYPAPLKCRVDANMLKQVILNLFINAQQAMKDGGELMVKTARAKQKALIEISDTGTGIEPGKLSGIFDAYSSSRSGGRGLGLLTSKKIIEAHKGEIKVESEIGKGTSFKIFLPIYKS